MSGRDYVQGGLYLNIVTLLYFICMNDIEHDDFVLLSGHRTVSDNRFGGCEGGAIYITC